MFCPWGPGATHVAESTIDLSAQAAAAVRKTLNTLVSPYLLLPRLPPAPPTGGIWLEPSCQGSLSAEQGLGRLVLAASSAEAGTCRNSQHDTGQNSSLMEHV